VVGQALSNQGQINLLENGATEDYNALQLIYNRRAAKGLSAGANYVWAHGLGTDTGGLSNMTWGMLPLNQKYDFGNQDLDVRQRVTFHATYALPFAASAHGLLAAAAQGWKFNVLGYYSLGMPFTVIDSASTNDSHNCFANISGCHFDRPNVIAKIKLAGRSINEWYNIDAFQAQTEGTLGNEGVNQVQGPPDRKLDISLNKDFTLRESLKLQFRAEAFNITNTVNFEPPNNQMNNLLPTGFDNTSQDQSFGKITSTSIGENPRQFQFALKLLF
jgi:hypothetical protein